MNLANLKKIFFGDDGNSDFSDISNLRIDNKISDIFIIGNGPSLNNITSEQLSDKFTIGTNRSWLWGSTDILIWRDNRITEEINFFQLEKQSNSIWVCSQDKSFIKNELIDYKHTKKLVDYTFSDSWMKRKLELNIKWNGIVFHAIALAKHISQEATIHLVGIDLELGENHNHHFFNKNPGFNQGFYKSKWDRKNFNYQSRLDMMYKNFESLKNNGYNFKNYSNNSRLNELFGYEEFK